MIFSRSSENDREVGIAIRALLDAGIRFRKATNWQLKVGAWNYYPKKGTIYKDGDPEQNPKRGLEAFIELLRNEGYGGEPIVRRTSQHEASNEQVEPKLRPILPSLDSE